MRDAVDSVDKETFDRVWTIIAEISAQERQFNGIQNGYRNMASGWLLATFAGMGFALTQTIHIGIDRELLLAVIALSGSIGIALLWVLDLLVYHRLLDSYFIEGLALERRYSWLPPFRANMMATQKGQGVLSRVVSFYLAPVVLLVGVAGSALSLWCYRANRPYAAVLSAAAGVALAAIVGAKMRRQTVNTAETARRLAKMDSPPPA